MTTQTEYTAAAREFVAAYVRTGRQWDTLTLASYLPQGRVLCDDEIAYSGPVTIAEIARWMRLYSRDA